ncbi:MAG TPA: sialidase family protein [Gaiellaceae bacterium]
MKGFVALAAALCAFAVVGLSGAAAGTGPVQVTDDQFAANEESLGMSPDGRVLMGMWNDWHFNDGCGISYSTDGGATWAPESFAPGFTFFTNDPAVPGTGPFAVAGDPVVVYNPSSGLFDVICQSFGGRNGNQVQLLSTTFDASKADASDPADSYGLDAWRLPAVPIAVGTSNGSQKGSNGKFPDHEAGTVDTGTGPGHHFGRLYVAWAEFSGGGKSPIDLAYSDNDGASWTGPIRVSDAGHQFDQDATPRVGPDGAVYVSYTNGPNEKSTKSNAVLIAKSTNGGNSFGPSFVAAPIAAPATGLPNALYRGGTDATSTVDQRTGDVVVVYNDDSSGALNVWATHTATPGDLSTFTPAEQVKPSGQTQFFPWLQSAPNGRVDLAYYDRSCDPSDVLVCVTLSSSSDSGATWTSQAVTTTGFDGDTFGACLAFTDPPDCTNFFLGDYIAVASTDTKAQVMWTGNGNHTLDAFTSAVTP